MWSTSFLILVFNFIKYFIIFCVVQFSRSARQASLSITNSQSLLKLMSIEWVMPSNYLILCRPFSSCLQSFPASGSFQMSQFFTLGGQSIRASASVLLISFRIDWFDFPAVKGLSRVFSNT